MMKIIIQYEQNILNKEVNFMKNYKAEDIRNIAVTGHASKGKTTLKKKHLKMQVQEECHAFLLLQKWMMTGQISIKHLTA